MNNAGLLLVVNLDLTSCKLSLLILVDLFRYGCATKLRMRDADWPHSMGRSGGVHATLSGSCSVAADMLLSD